jgi:uncharacterized protein YneF (UPF0154 family)
MDWTHLIVIVLALAVGVFIGSKNPGLLAKATGGAVAA